jgi:nucleotide-binding universal stress UspA family protein
MKSILVPTDFSECSRNAMNYAMNLSKVFDCNITLLNAYHIPSAGILTVNWSLEDELKKDRVSQFLQIKQDLIKELPSAEIHTVSSLGFGVTSIIDELKRRDYDLVVMGTKGASKLKGVFMGSITATLIGKTKVPIMAIPEETSYVVPETFTLASDLKKLTDYSNLNFIAHLATQFKSNIEVVKIAEGAENNSTKETTESLEESYKLKESMGKLSYKLQIIDTNDIEKEILKITKSPKNVLTIIHRDRSFFGRVFHISLSKKLAMHSKTPLLILQDN